MTRATRWLALGACVIFLASLTDDASARGRRARTWVPQPAWDAVKQRAKSDLGSNVKLYKSGWSNRISRGLRGGGGEAYIVHARKTGRRSPWAAKTKGSYLVERSRQGIWEAFLGRCLSIRPAFLRQCV
jgi:hypothetical protein